jgi:hypothetical protein
VYHQEIRALVEAVHRTNFNTVSVLAVDTVFANNKCHGAQSPMSDDKGYLCSRLI